MSGSTTPEVSIPIFRLCAASSAHWGTAVTVYAMHGRTNTFSAKSGCDLRLYMSQYPQAANLCKAEQSVLQAITSKRTPFSKIGLLIQILYIQWKALISRAACKECQEETRRLW